MILQQFMAEWLPAAGARDARYSRSCVPWQLLPHYGMMQYHMGWVDERFVPSANCRQANGCARSFVLLACAATQGNPAQTPCRRQPPLKILHNFSLVHDDIEDGDETRRHRRTVWALWGVPLAINAGDGMFALSFAAMQGVEQPRGSPAGRPGCAARLYRDLRGVDRGPVSRHGALSAATACQCG
jgi:hypothetical protein